MEAMNWEEFDTSAAPPARRIGFWNERGRDALCDMSIQPKYRDRFSAKLSRIDFGALRMISVQSTAARAIGEGVNSGRPIQDCFMITLPERGRGAFEHNQSICEVEPGDLFINDIAEPWNHSCDGEMHLLIVRIPYSELLTRIDEPMRLVGQALETRCPHVAMTANIIRGAYLALKSQPSGDWQHSLADLVLDSLRVLYEGSSFVKGRAADKQKFANIRREALSIIVRNLENPELSVTHVADALGIGTRRLQRAFVEVGETPTQVLIAQRLDRAARELLRSRGATGTSILDIALSVGFSDASHFSWSFARRFGVSPRKYRDVRARSPACRNS